VGLWPLASWKCELESRLGHGSLSPVSAVCCQIEVSATGRSLVQRSPAKCGVSERDREASTIRSPWPTRIVDAWGKKRFLYTVYVYARISRSTKQAQRWVAVWFQTIQNSALVGVGGHYYAPGRFIPGKDQYPLYRGLGGPRGGMEARKILPPAGIRSPDSPTHSESLCRLSYPGRHARARARACVCVCVCVTVSE